MGTSRRGSAKRRQSVQVALPKRVFGFGHLLSSATFSCHDFEEWTKLGDRAAVVRVKGSTGVEKFVLKCYRVGVTSKARNDDLHTEVETLVKLSRGASPFLMELYSQWIEGRTLCVLSEFCLAPLAKFASYWAQASLPVFPFLVVELTLASEFLHTQGFVHRSLDCQSVCISQDGHVKIVKFDSLASLANGLVSGVAGNPICTAPEMPVAAYGTAVDFWQLGLIVFYFCTQRHPFLTGKESSFECYQRAANWALPEDHFREISKNADLRDLILGLLNPSPNARLTASSIRSHPLTEAVDWHRAATLQVPSPFCLDALSRTRRRRMSMKPAVQSVIASLRMQKIATSISQTEKSADSSVAELSSPSQSRSASSSPPRAQPRSRGARAYTENEVETLMQVLGFTDKRPAVVEATSNWIGSVPSSLNLRATRSPSRSRVPRYLSLRFSAAAAEELSFGKYEDRRCPADHHPHDQRHLARRSIIYEGQWRCHTADVVPLSGTTPGPTLVYELPGRPHGLGSMWVGAQEFAGEFCNGWPHGYGVIVIEGDVEVYVGQWQNGKRHGLGKLSRKTQHNLEQKVPPYLVEYVRYEKGSLVEIFGYAEEGHAHFRPAIQVETRVMRVVAMAGSLGKRLVGQLQEDRSKFRDGAEGWNLQPHHMGSIWGRRTVESMENAVSYDAVERSRICH
mmetsp:Transcript_27013/g.69915  ORF Transcript_27013/g.69915 Transcript_27013/m.69915 type:complete len:682 (-) Transcript_27013:74-2119(-)